MNYKQWSEQYFLQASELNHYLKKLKRQLTNKSDSDAKDLNYRISLIYPMYLEMKHTGKYLKSCERRDHNV